jgi:prolycopene isomerase
VGVKPSRPVAAGRYDAIIVGAGYGGVTCAASLASRGARVLLVDKNARPGGKAMLAARRSGVVSELWPIAGGPALHSRFDDLLKLLGLPVDTLITPDPVTEFCYLAENGQQYRLRVPAKPIRNPLQMLSMVTAFGDPPTGALGLLRLNLHSLLLRGQALERYDQVDMLSYLRRFNLPPGLHDWIASLMNLFFVVPVDELPVSEAILTLRSIAAGGAGRYHRGGYGRIAEAAVDYLIAHGGQWLPSTRVRQIRVEQGRVAGIVTQRGESFDAPVVVSNAGMVPTVLKLVPDQALPAGYVARIRQLKPSWAFVGVRYDLARPWFDVPMTVMFSAQSAWDRQRFAQAEAGHWPTNPLLFVTVPSLYDPALATAAVPQVALIGVLGSPDPGSPMSATAVEKLEAMVDRLWPGLRAVVRHRRVYGAAAVSLASRDAVLAGHGGECIGLGQLIGQCGRSKPDCRAPLPGLYFVGCDAGGRGIGTTQAVDSGFNVAQVVWRARGLIDWSKVGLINAEDA